MSNPFFASKTWENAAGEAETAREAMTVEGAVFKTGILFFILACTCGWMWSTFWNQGKPAPAEFMPWLIGGAIAALVLSLITWFAPRWAMATATLYAAAKGLLLGGITMLFQLRYPGLPLLATAYTAATLIAMLILYRTGVLRATPMFKKCVIGGTVALGLGLLILSLLGMFGIGQSVAANLYGAGPIGIGFSLLCIGLAAFNLVLDFDVIEEGARTQAPKYMEWVAAFGLMVTLVWLYIEILRLLAKLRGGDD